MQNEIRYYEHLADREKIIHHTLQIIILIGATSVPLLLNFSDLQKGVPTIISLIVAVAAAIANYFRFGARSREFNLTAEKLIQEMNDEHLRLGSYKENLSTEERIELFHNRTLKITQEQRLRTFSFAEDRQVKKHSTEE